MCITILYGSLIKNQHWCSKTATFLTWIFAGLLRSMRSDFLEITYRNFFRKRKSERIALDWLSNPAKTGSDSEDSR